MTKTPRQRRKEKNRDSILDATASLIVRYGYENVSLRDIAKQADYSPAGLYKYFESKLGIFRALQTRENLELIKQFETLPKDLAPKERLLDLCMLYIDYCLENRAYLALVNNLSSSRTSKQQPVPENSPYRVLYQCVGEWVKTENISLPNQYGLEEITYALWAQIHGMATLRLNQLKNFEADFTSANRLTLEIFLNGIIQWARK